MPAKLVAGMTVGKASPFEGDFLCCLNGRKERNIDGLGGDRLASSKMCGGWMLESMVCYCPGESYCLRIVARLQAEQKSNCNDAIQKRAFS